MCVLLFVCVGAGMCRGIFPMCSTRLMCFLVLACGGQRHPPSLSASALGYTGKFCAVCRSTGVLQHAELGNGEWKVQQCKSSAPLDSLER